MGLSIFYCNYYIIQQANPYCYSSVEKIPHNKVGLLLGTSKYIRNGTINLFYQNRINATVELFKAGKIDYVLVSGDNGHSSYDEPTTFKKDLVLKGIPANKIYLDYAGFRTLDSVIRCKEIFGQNSITIISQLFHNERAVYLAKKHKINAIAFNAYSVPEKYAVKVKIREYFARSKAVIDIIIGKKPKFLGEKISII